MKAASIYDSRGAILESMEGSEEDIRLFTIGKQFIEGFFPANKYYVSQSQAIEFSPKPDNTVWDWNQKQWVVSFDILNAEARRKRNKLLNESDWTQLADINPDIKELWKPYRQALRDITNQPGYPLNIIWPTPPQG
jgi:hypothetical protein